MKQKGYTLVEVIWGLLVAAVVVVAIHFIQKWW